MNKIALLLTLTITAVAITITTSVTTNTEANVTTPFSAAVSGQDIKSVLTLDNTVTQAGTTEAEIEINDGTQVLSTITTTTTIDSDDTQVDSATADASANFTEGTEIIE